MKLFLDETRLEWAVAILLALKAARQPKLNREGELDICRLIS
jgi:hypothetical protein